MNTERSTPESSANAFVAIKKLMPSKGVLVVPIETAQRLERERDEAREKLRWEQEERKAWKTLCENYHASNKDILGERAKLIRQRDRLLEALNRCLPMLLDTHEVAVAARAAIAEVEGGR